MGAGSCSHGFDILYYYMTGVGCWLGCNVLMGGLFGLGRIVGRMGCCALCKC
jgi:hypothetical protein